MKIYIGHSTNYDYENELYKIIRNDNELKDYTIVLPHEKNYLGNNTREFYNNIDLFIAEVTYKSTGLGIELGFAYDDHVPIYCIYKNGENISSSSIKMISDYIYGYSTPKELVNVIKDIIKDYNSNLKNH